MKFFKKISMFIVMALIVTIGGVYAAWVYPSDDAKVGTVDKTFTGNMTQVSTQSTSKGNITIDTASDDMKIFVDDTGSYVAGAQAQGDITVRFTPVDGVSDDIANNGIAMEANIYITGDQTTIKDDGNHDVKIFTVTTSLFDLGNGTRQPDGSFTVTITGEQILACLAFCKDGAEDHTVTLDTLAENTAFGEALKTYTINVKIQEKVN